MVRLSSMAHGGPALGREDDGRVVLVDGGLPPEVADVQLTNVKPRMATGVLARLPDPPSPDRSEPPCPHFGHWPERGLRPAEACGGCQWQHARYDAQLRYKREIIADALRRIARLTDPPVAEAMGMDHPWAYRNRLTLRTGQGGPGLVAVDGASVIPIRDCPIAHPLLSDLLHLLEGFPPWDGSVVMRVGARTGDRMIVLRDPHGSIDEIDIDTDASVVLSGAGGTELAAGRPYLVERLAGRAFLIPPESFFQANTAMAETLVDLVRSAIPQGSGLLVDAFSGVGTFALLLADRAAEVIAIEADRSAVAAAVENATGLDNVTLWEGSVTEALYELPVPPDVLLVDPPRTGLPRGALRYLADRRPSTIIYVSCEPTTFARDTASLLGAGYRLETCQPVDMFPQSFHVETVSVLRAS